MNGRTKSADRRYFIGGSDARIIMGNDEAPSCGFGKKNGARSNPRTCPATSSSSSGLSPRSLIGAGMRRIPGSHHGCPAAGPTSNGSVDGRDPRRPCRGQRRGVRSEIHAAVVVLGGSGGGKIHGPAAA